MATFSELYATMSDAVTTAIESALGKVFTALPATLKTDGDGHTISAVSAVKGAKRTPDGKVEQIDMPPFETVPIHYAGGGRMVSTHPTKSGDEGIVLFASRPLDSWHQNGGSQNPIDGLIHRLSDGIWFGGVRSDPNKLENVSGDAIHHRSKDGKVTRETHPDTGAHDKAVDPSDTSSNPFADATKFFSSKVHPTSGNAWDRVSPDKRHSISMTDSGIAMSVLDIPSGQGAGFGLSPGAGPGGCGMTMPSGAAAGNIGTLGGDLSGTLPNPNVVSILHVAGADALTDATDDAAAATAGVAVGHLYRTGSVLKVRVA